MKRGYDLKDLNNLQYLNILRESALGKKNNLKVKLRKSFNEMAVLSQAFISSVPLSKTFQVSGDTDRKLKNSLEAFKSRSCDELKPVLEQRPMAGSSKDVSAT